MLFCNKHRLPENHECAFDLRKKGIDTNSRDITPLIYEDALEYVSKELTVAKIYEYVTTKSMNKAEAIDLLDYFIENSENSEIRKISILAFKVLELKSNKAYSVLENCLLSDEDPDVKRIAEKIISYNFPKKSKELLNLIKRHNKNLKGRN